MRTLSGTAGGRRRFWAVGAVADLLARQPLRRRLLAMVLLLATGVLLAAGFATSSALRTYLQSRMDSQLAQISKETAIALAHGDLDADRVQIPPEGAVRFVVSHEGDRPFSLPSVPGTPGTEADLSPKQQADLAEKVRQMSPRTVDNVVLGEPYRLAGAPLDDDSTLVVGLPLRSLEETMKRLVMIELAVGLAGLAVTAIAGSFLIRVGLAPLARITATTRRIATSDLSGPEAAVRLRAPALPPRTEVGQLGSGMNHMLEAIDASFDARNEAERKLRQFIADASHELRTPLATIRGYAELFERVTGSGSEADLEELGTAMRRTAEESARMSILVDDLLLLARLDQGRPLARGPVDLCRLAIDAASDFRVRDDQRPIRLAVPAEPLIVDGDEARLQQVLANLLSNVHAHTPPGTLVDLSVSRTGCGAELMVHDDGPGMPSGAAGHAFDRFYRADTSRARASGGTGLGLAIVQAVVDAHCGTVTLDTEQGSTTLTVRLPAAHNGEIART